jgi:hypothetical protein
VILTALLLSACPAAAPLPEGDAYVRGLLDAQRGREEALSRYSYDVSEVVDDLDASGGVRKRRSRELEVYFVKGRPVRQLVGRNGQPLTGREREKEERRAREEAEAIAKGNTASELPGVRLSKLLARYRFLAVGREELAGRCAIAFDFEPRPGDFELDWDSVFRRLRGRLWVDEADQAVAKVAVDNSSGIKIALGLAVSVKTLAFRAEFAHLEDGVWLPRSLETLVVGRKLLVSALRVRTTLTYGHYRRFDVEVDDDVDFKLRADEADAPKPPPPKPEL